jgi:hypothetical protein
MSLAHRVARLREVTTDGPPRLRRVLDMLQFTKSDVIGVTGVANHQLHNWVSRGWITLSGEQNPGKGKRRLYTGIDAISLSLGLQLQPFGMMQVATRLSRGHQMSDRASSMLLDRSFKWGRAIAIIPSSEKRAWHYVPFGPGTTRTAHDFRAAIILDVDRVILETLERLTSLIQGKQVEPLTQPVVQPRSNGECANDRCGDEFIRDDDYVVVPAPARSTL